MMLLTDRYAEKISGVLSCFDRVVIQGTLPKFCYSQGMAGFLSYTVATLVFPGTFCAIIALG